MWVRHEPGTQRASPTPRPAAPTTCPPEQEGSGKSIGDTVCVRPWAGDGYCAVVEAADPTRYRLRVSRVIGCAAGCAPEPACAGGQVVGAGGLGAGDVLWVPASCLTHTGVR